MLIYCQYFSYKIVDKIKYPLNKGYLIAKFTKFYLHYLLYCLLLAYAWSLYQRPAEPGTGNHYNSHHNY